MKYDFSCGHKSCTLNARGVELQALAPHCFNLAYSRLERLAHVCCVAESLLPACCCTDRLRESGAEAWLLPDELLGIDIEVEVSAEPDPNEVEVSVSMTSCTSCFVT